MVSTASLAHPKRVQILNRVNEAIMGRDYKEVRGIYIDFALLKDIRLGLMLAISSPEDREYIISHVKEYNDRLDRKFKTCFPKIKYTEDALNAMLKDEKFSDFALDFAPDTELSYLLQEYLGNILERNHKSKYFLKVPITINIYPLHDTPLVRQCQEAIKAATDSKDFLVSFIREEPVSIKTEYWGMYDVLFIDNIEPLCAEGTPWEVPMKEAQWLTKNIFAPPVISDASKKKWDEEKLKMTERGALDISLETTAQMLEFCCRFQFVTFNIPIPNEGE